MKRTRENGKARKKDIIPAVRASISFPTDVYETLAVIAKEKKVSLAWVIRDAAEQYISRRSPKIALSRADMR